MAENADGQEKTEAASGKKLDDARNKGSVAKSQDATSAAVLLFGAMVIYRMAPSINDQLTGFMKQMLRNATLIYITDQNVSMYYQQLILFISAILVPVLVMIMLIGVVAEISQVGFKFATKKFTEGLNFSKIFNPLGGIKKLFFSTQSWFELGKGIVKILILGSIAYQVLDSKTDRVLELMARPIQEMGGFIWETAFELVFKMGGAFVAIAAADYFYQKFKFKTDMKMTKQEVKEEGKQMEGDQQTKQRIKQIGRQRIRKIMLQRVKQADVVIVNPTHYAVALQYKPMSGGAPIVVAKGVEFLALKIREIAKEANVPIVEEPPLARALYASVEIDQEIPEVLFQAVAQVLAFVFKMKKKAA
ncbi:MAG TPA: flagellar biosynthesis protein FlhB [Patescibacteria group bacterium]|nr:flagellar biosynthesis protein FlhB [Patescibacteria group bacterium]